MDFCQFWRYNENTYGQMPCSGLTEHPTREVSAGSEGIVFLSGGSASRKIIFQCKTQGGTRKWQEK